MSFSNKFVGRGLTYDDVLLVPSFSETLPEVSLLLVFLGILFKYSHSFCGHGYCHREQHGHCHGSRGWYWRIAQNMSIEDQADKVRTVKRAESGMIIDPVV